MQIKGEMITGNDFRRMAVGAYSTFMNQYEYINSLNVFPVPDGDTGTNMLLTLRAVARVLSEASEEGIGSLARRAADSAIMGARGNSGVILAQIFRGIARGLAGKDQASSSEIGKSFQYGVLYAYRAVARPVEGTILTVAKGIAKGTRRAVRDNLPLSDILRAAVGAGEAELERTPDLLPALKAAGVVDAGGKGLIVFLAGCLEGLEGTFSSPEANFSQALIAYEPEGEGDAAHPYCTEFILRHSTISLAQAKQQLLDMGDSLVVAEGPDLLKVHIHTAHPGAVLEAAVAWGTLHAIKIDNMADQHSRWEPPTVASARTPIAVVSVAAGEGIASIMRELGAAVIIPGGQTMNPPVENFIAAVHSGCADQYIILPNNKNILMAAEQVKKLLGDRVEIVPTVNIPQGMAALVAFSADTDMQTNVAAMKLRFSGVHAAGVTKAVRDTVVDGRPVAAGTFIGIVGNEVMAAGNYLEQVLVNLIEIMVRADSEMISLYYGAEVTALQADEMANRLRTRWPDIEVEFYYGGQPHYFFIISVE